MKSRVKVLLRKIVDEFVTTLALVTSTTRMTMRVKETKSDDEPEGDNVLEMAGKLVR
jgi:hypothetical protein